jgi:hypothetical protein
MLWLYYRVISGSQPILYAVHYAGCNDLHSGYDHEAKHQFAYDAAGNQTAVIDEIIMNKSNELEHLFTAPDSMDSPGRLGLVRFSIQCQNNPEQVLLHAREILQTLLNHQPNEIGSQLSLPNWFTSAFAPEKSMEEAEQWLKWWKSLPKKEQEIALKEAVWSLEDWLYWMQPDIRQWFWWDVIIDDSNCIKVAVEVEEWPFAWGSLEWLFKASGAIAIRAEE